MEKQTLKNSKKSTRRDSSMIFVAVFAVLFIALGLRGFIGGGMPGGIIGCLNFQ